MDICKLQKKAILIPTPGQTEQEYLAGHLYEQGWCLTVSQHEFSLNKALLQAKTFPFKIPNFKMDYYRKIIEQLISSLQNG
jgi:UDP-N-acetylglucosamine:LPS N-acetylglucosamine transferase